MAFKKKAKSWANLPNDDPEYVIGSSNTYDVQDGRVGECSTYVTGFLQTGSAQDLTAATTRNRTSR